MIFLTLFITFFEIGLFGFGGGYGMLSLIQTEVVYHHGWMTSAEFSTNSMRLPLGTTSTGTSFVVPSVSTLSKLR